MTALAVPHGTSNPVLDLFECSTSHGVPSMPSCAWYLAAASWIHLIPSTTEKSDEHSKIARAPIMVVILKPTLNAILCRATHVATVWINRVRLPVLHVVSSTGKIGISLSAFAAENLISRDEFGSHVPRQPAHLHTQAESRAYLRDSSRVSWRRPFIASVVSF